MLGLRSQSNLAAPCLDYHGLTQAPVTQTTCSYSLRSGCKWAGSAAQPGRIPRICMRSNTVASSAHAEDDNSQRRSSLNGPEIPNTSRRTLLGRLSAAPAGLLALPALLDAALPYTRATPPAQAANTRLRPPSDAERAALVQALKKVVERPKAPVLLRLPFHDAGTFSLSGGRDGGANASVRFELDRPENFGLKRGWKVIEQLANALEGTPAASTVSLADLVVIAGAYAVQLCDGPAIELRIGRPDAAAPDPEGRLPDENASAAQLKAAFADKGFGLRELVALSGAHTVGGKGFGAPYGFDNTYYKELLKKPWTNTKDSMASMIGLPSDHVLPDDPEMLPIIQEYADNQNAFFRDFSAAYVKLSELGVQQA